MKLQKFGGYAAISLACVSIVFIAASSAALSGPDEADETLGMMAAYQASPIAFQILYLTIALSGIFTLLIVLALQERMQSNAPNLMRVAVIAASVASALLLTAASTGFLRNSTLAASKDTSAYRALLVVWDSLTFSANRTMGFVFLLVGWAAISAHALPRILSYILLLYGIEGIVEIFMQGIMPTIGLILWWALTLLRIIISIWLGAVLLSNREPSRQSVSMAR